MSQSIRVVFRWLPALLVMLTIFSFSAQPASELPSFEWADRIVKKTGHMLGYALLVVSYWRAFDFRPERRWLAWCFTVLYAMTDELHQSLVPGRFPSIWDVLIFDNLGALISLWLWNHHKTQRSDSLGPIAERADAKR